MSVNFLTKVSPKRIRKEIQNICESYSHPWDVLAELAQNSVDAIIRWQLQNSDLKRDHFIRIELDQKRRSVKFSDSGSGINPSSMPQLLAPNETDKENEDLTIGKKGVGLKFAIFSSNYFSIETTSPLGSYSAILRNAMTWRNSSDDHVESLPTIENEKAIPTKIDPLKTGTMVYLENLDSLSNPIFEISFNRMEYLLRTKTAIGSTKKRFGKSGPDIRVYLQITTVDGKKDDRQIPFEYCWVDQYFDKKAIVDMDDFLKRAANLNDQQKVKELTGKYLKTEGILNDDGRLINYFCFFVPSRDDWLKAAERNKLFNPIKPDVTRENSDIVPGIFVSTKGMPTGIEISPPIRAAGGYWENMFVLLEYDNFSFDLGRKTIPGRTQGVLKEIAYKQFRTFITWHAVRGKQVSAGSLGVAKFARTVEFEDLGKIPDLGLREINYAKNPNGQEASVVSIFHELIGKGLLLGYYCYSSGYKKNYDFWGKYRIDASNLGEEIKHKVPQQINENIVIEFKYDAADLVEDVQSSKKDFEEIDLVVCWDINEGKLKENSINVSPLPLSKVLYYGSNYILEWPGVFGLGNRSDMPVISLRRFVEDVRKMGAIQ